MLVRALSALLHQRRSAWLRSLLRGATEANVCERSKKSASKLVGTAGNKVEKAANAAHHVYGRKHEDAACRFGDHGARTVPTAVGAHRLEGSVRIFALHRAFRQGQTAAVVFHAFRRTCDREVAGSTLTHCAVVYGPGQTRASITKQYNLAIVEVAVII